MDEALYNSMDMPVEYYIYALLLMLSTCFIFYYKKRNIGIAVVWSLLLGYVFLIFSSTVLTRAVKADFTYNLHIFWSYQAIKKGKEYLLFLNIANVIMLMPVGFLLGCMKDMGYKKVALLGASISSVIEFSQQILKRGLFEFDDIFHNTLGCIVGYLIYKLCRSITNMRKA